MLVCNIKCCLILGLAAFFISCSSIYKINSPNLERNPLQVIDSLDKLNKYFILRSGTKAFKMVNTEIIPEDSSITTNLGPLPPNHLVHVLYNEYPKRTFLYGKSTKRIYNSKDSNSVTVLNEAHIYLKDSFSSIEFGNTKLYANNILKIELPQHDAIGSKKHRSYGTAVAIGGGGALVGMIVLLISVSSMGFWAE